MAESLKRHAILGTAGHIDHGKTALVKALTGQDTDRLAEEKARGLTIDLGFAHFGDQATIIDVPGHEKFVKNMVAGVSTIDLALFVIAADDGVMPQTREHLDILNILQVRAGIIVLTKIDLVDEEWLELVTDDIKSLVQGTALQDAPIMPVSSISGAGIPELRKAIQQQLAALPPRPDRGVYWQPVDRVFSMHGFGTVATGSILSGRVQVGDTVEVLPAGQQVRVRGIQKHHAGADDAEVGDRAAVNLHAIAIDAIQRGDVLASAGYFKATSLLHVQLALLNSAKALKANTRVRLHLGTAEVMARVRPIQTKQLEPGERGYAQLNLEKPVAARRLDPFVLRSYSPALTIGGGAVLDAAPRPFRSKDANILQRLQGFEREDPVDLLREQLFGARTAVLSKVDLVAATGLDEKTVTECLNQLIEKNEVQAISKKQFIHSEKLNFFMSRLLSWLESWHTEHPTSPGFNKAELAKAFGTTLAPPLQERILQELVSGGKMRDTQGFLALQGFEINLNAEQQQLLENVLEQLENDRYTPSTSAELASQFHAREDEVLAILGVLAMRGEIIRIDNNLHFHSEVVDAAKASLVKVLAQAGQIMVPEFKDLVEGASRKYALPLLNYFDAAEITMRDGDIRYPGVNSGV